MKKSLLLFAVMLLPLSLMAQNEYQEWKTFSSNYQNVDISKYYTPDIVRNALSINLNMNAENNTGQSYVQYRNIYNSLSSSNSTASNNVFLGNVTADFSRYTNTRKKISTISANLSLRENFQYSSIKNYVDNLESEDIVQNTKITSNNSLSIYWANKHYIYKPLFIIYDVNGNFSYGFSQDKIKHKYYESNSKTNATTVYFNPRLGVGYGRIEDVEDARQAVYIANALSKNGVLTRNLSDEEMFDLSRQISTVKNKRFLDSRLRLIDEISTVDSFFVKKDLLHNNGAAYFTTLYDMWQYGALYSRKSGYEIAFAVRPNYTYEYKYEFSYLEPNMRDTSSYSHRATIYSYLVFNYEKPVKLNWQHSIEVGVEAAFRQGKIGQTDFNSIFSNREKLFWAWTQYSLGYYPNTRTRISANIGQQITKQQTKGIDFQFGYQTYRAIISADLSYYFSPQFRFTGTCNLNYEHYFSKGAENTHSKHNGFSSLFNVQLVYAFF